MTEWFFAASRVLVVAGKGGVGKTTVGASIGVAAAEAGLDVLLVELDERSGIGRPFAHNPLDYTEQELERTRSGGRIRGRRITPDDALADYLAASGLRRFTDRLTPGAVDVVAAAAPGLRDLLALGKIRQLEQAGAADLIVVDAPASGHAISFLRAPAGLASASSSGPIRRQADLALAMLGDAARCQVVLVTRPEEAPVTETVETAYSLEERVGVKLGPVVVNGCWPEIPGLAAAVSRPGGDPVATAAAEYRLTQLGRQTDEIARLERELPLPRISLPLRFTAELDRRDLGVLADAVRAPR
ncbi:MAG: ArsA family ATPase [Acidimicrobiales bacterium]